MSTLDKYDFYYKQEEVVNEICKILFENENLKITFQDPYFDVYLLNQKGLPRIYHYQQKLHKDSWAAKIYIELINREG